MKVGVITYHDTANYGAALQAIATVKYVTELGYDAEAIDYTNDYRGDSYNLVGRVSSLVNSGRILSAIKNLAAAGLIFFRKKRFSSFYAENLKLSRRKYIGDDILKEKLNYEAYVAGSDQIWNFANNGGDANYALSFVDDDSIKISYASSFGMSAIIPGMKDSYGEKLRRIAFPSVREKTGADLFEELTGIIPTIVLDPVFLLDRHEWEGMAKVRPVTCGAVVTYLSDVKYLREFRNVSGGYLNNKRIIQFGSDLSIKDLFNLKSKFAASLGPESFLAQISVASMVLTSSFHGVVLSIIFERSFVVFLSGNDGRDSRIVDLLTSLGLEDRIYNSSRTNELLKGKIDYKLVHIKLAKKITESKRFFQSSLSEISARK